MRNPASPRTAKCFIPLKQTTALALAIGMSFPALAQQRPDAGRVLQETKPPALQAPRKAVGIGTEVPNESDVLPGGKRVILQSVKFTGQSVFAEGELLDILGEFKGKTFDLSGLKALAGRISEHYRANGYSFARALIPAQSFAEGMLTIQVVEGRYGNIVAQGDKADEAQPFLAGLKKGAVISSTLMERTILLLADQPGVKVEPLVRPGQEVGTGDLIVQVSSTPSFKGEVGIDNHGNRYSGSGRVKVNLQADSPFMLGDQVQLKTLYSEEHMWLGSLGYSLPLGASGLRGRVGYDHTLYELGEDFASLGAYGTAKVTNLGLSYPIIRSQKTNLAVGATWQSKRLTDRQDSTATSFDKSSNSLPISLQFDHRDALVGGGVTFGTLGYTPGRLHLDDELDAVDKLSNMDIRGSFNKWNFDLARLQLTGIQGLTLFGRFSGQWAEENLDSSEGFGLGGASGVRAYPQGEGSGDEGWLTQMEVRYQMGAFAPYGFYDSGKVYVHADENRITPTVLDNTRSIAGGGLGVRYSGGSWSADAAVAWRHQGGRATSDTQDRDPRFWMTANYQF